jgi:Domain of unknown function (DUF4136)
MRHHRVFGSGCVVAAAVLAAACAPSIRSQRDANIPVPRGATWGWAGQAARASTAPTGRRYISERNRASAGFGPIVQQRFRRAIAAAMEARGLRQVPDSAEPDFLVSFTLGDEPVFRRGGVAGAHVAVGYYGGWGYRPLGLYPGWGYYRPWGFYRPWGWGWEPWGWGFGFTAYPMNAYDGYGYRYGGRAYREGALQVELRLRSDGEVAWIGRYRTEPYEVQRMSPQKVQKVVDQLFATLH